MLSTRHNVERHLYRVYLSCSESSRSLRLEVRISRALCNYRVRSKYHEPMTYHKLVDEFINGQVNECSSNEEGKTLWGDKCNSSWSSSKIVNHIINNLKLNNPYEINKPLIQTSQDPRIQAEGKAGQSTDKGIIFVSENDFESEAGSEWIIGTCVKSPCVAAGNNELVSAYR